ncbi:MAG TPA: sodium:solute symporter [Clostridia bacterium]
MVKYLILVAFFASMIIVGIFTRKSVKTTDDFIIGGRKMGPWLSGFSYVTTYFSAVIFVGYAGRFGWGFGLSATWIGIGNALIGSLFAWVLLAERTRRMTTEMGVATLAEFFYKRYDSKMMEKAAAVIIFVFLIPYSASVYQGLGYIMQIFFAGTFMENINVSMFVMALITAIYVFFGGYISTAVNSLIQGVIMMGGVVIIFIRILNVLGGLKNGILTLSNISAAGVPAGSLVSAGGPQIYTLVVLILMTSFGTFGLPQMISKFHGIKNRDTSRKATIVSVFGAILISGGAYLMGGFSRALVETQHITFNTKNLDTLMPAIFQAILSPELMAVLVVLMLSASMSTLAAVVLVSAPTFSKTILKKDGITTIRILCMLFILVSFLVAVIPSAIVTLMAFSWGALSGSFIGPYIWGLYSKRITRIGSWAGMVCGLGTVVVGAGIALVLTPASATSWAPQLAVLAMIVSMVVTPVASLLTAGKSRIPEGAKFV